MSHSEITYADKVENNGATPAGRFGADDLNEIKTVTNANGSSFDVRIDALEAGGGGVNNLTSSGHVGDGTTVTFPLSFAPTTEVPQAFVVGIDGVLQSPIDAYTVSTTTDAITFSSAPPVNAEIVVSTANVLTGTDISASTIISTGSTTTRLLADRFADTVNVKDFGAVGDGVADDTAAIVAAKAAASTNGVPLLIPQGLYLTNGTVYDSAGGLLYFNDSFTIPVNLAQQARNNQILITASTPDTTPQDPADSRIGMGVTIEANGSNHASGVRSNLVNKSDDGNGCTAFYGRSTNYSNANWGAAVHGETRHNGGTSLGLNSENAGYSSSGTMIGVNCQNTTGTTDLHPEAGGASNASPSDSVAFNVLGSSHTATVGNNGRWGYGLRIKPDSVRTTGKAIAIECESTIGIDLRDATLNHAIALKDGQQIKFEDSLQIAAGYNSSAAGGPALEFVSGSNVNIRLYNSGICDFLNDIRPAVTDTNKLGGTTRRFLEVHSKELVMGGTIAVPLNVSTGAGSPEAVVTAAVGSMYTRTDGGAGTTLYVKESGTGNTGWIAK